MVRQLFEILFALPDQHRQALEWFQQHRGREVSWPDALPNGTFLVNKAKGIHKPAGWRHALSVRQVLSSPYADKEPAFTDNGTWTYLYYQEGKNPADRDKHFTNRGLLACMEDGVPVGVLRQTRSSPNSRYEVLGLALVRAWEDGYFLLEDISANGELEHQDGDKLDTPISLEDARKRLLTEIVQRQGQGRFREDLLAAYGSRCAVTGCNATEALEAAHIVPYRGPHTSHVSNGLLLRSDIHTLFDLGLIAIDSASMTLLLSPRLQGTSYNILSGTPLSLPTDALLRPSKAALDEHRRSVFASN